MPCSSRGARCARRSRRCSTTAAPSACSSRCLPTAATESFRSALTTSARTCLPRATSTSMCACAGSTGSTRSRSPRPHWSSHEGRGMNHLLSIDDLDRAGIERIVEQATRFAEVSDREIKKVPALRGRMVLNLFYEASTRTRSSFELAAKRLSADVVNFAASGSSVEKGESLKDTILTLSAHKPDAIVIRTPWAGAAALVSKWCSAAIVNAGDGKREHPTQALLDVYTLRQRVGD